MSKQYFGAKNKNQQGKIIKWLIMKIKNVIDILRADGGQLSLRNDEVILTPASLNTVEVAQLIHTYSDALKNYIQSQNAYWQSRFLNYEPVSLHNLCLPQNKKGHVAQCITGAQYAQLISEVDAGKATLQARIFHSLSEAIAVYTGQSDVVINVWQGESKGQFTLPVRYTHQGKPLSLEQYHHHLTQDLMSSYFDKTELEKSIGINCRDNPLASIEVAWFDKNTNLSAIVDTRFKMRIIIHVDEGELILKWYWVGKFMSEASITAVLGLFEDNLLNQSQSQSLSHLVDSHQFDARGGGGVLGIFEGIVQQTPHKVALYCDEQKLTYQVLANSAQVIAANLMLYGVVKGTRVVIILPRGAALAEAILGVTYAGGVYVPVSPNETQTRLETVIKQSQALAVIGHADGDSSAVPVFSLKQLRKKPAGHFVSQQVSKESPLYINFSSGSTGEPKGIVCVHRGVERLVLNPNYISLDAETTMLCAANQSFDAFVFEFWGALLNGGSVHMLGESELNPENLRTLFSKKVNTAFLTAALFHALVEIDPHIFNGLEQLIVGGDVVLPSHVNTVYQHNAQIQIINGYGPTENTVFTSCFPIPREWPDEVALPIGKAINGTSIVVLASNGALLPHGAIGEIVTMGAGLASGYLNIAQEQGRFIEIESSQGAVKAYKTGDLGYFDSQGQLHFRGRKDAQVKINGYRVELTAIDQLVLRQSGVRHAMTIAIGENVGKKLVSFISAVKEEDNIALKEHILQLLRNGLPTHMVPNDICFVKHIPVTLNGKVDTSALVNLYQNRGRASFLAPSTPLQAALCEYVSLILDVKPVGIEDNFFQLGGNSVTLLRFLALCQQHLGLGITLNELFQYPTVAAISELARIKKPVIIPNTNDKQLSFAEERLLFIQSIKEAEVAYNAPFLFELSEDFDCERLLDALERVAQRHTVLKTLYKKNRHHKPFPWVSEQHFSLKKLEVQTDIARTQTLVAHANAVFDLTQELPVKLTLIEQGMSRYLLINIHHIVIDGWSLSILFRELSYFYAKKGTLPALCVNYRDYAAWQRKALTECEKGRLKVFWQDYLLEAENMVLPYEQLRCKPFDYIGQSQYFTLDEALSNSLKQFAQAHSTTLYHVMLSGFFALCHKLSQQLDLVIGTPFENRYITETQSLIGFFVNSLPIRVKLEKSTVTMLELLQMTIKSVAKVRDHQALPLNDIVQVVETNFDADRAPVFQVLFSVQSFTRQSDLPAGMRLTSHQGIHTAAKYDMTILIDDSSNQIEIDWNYATALFSDKTISRFARMYQTLLVQLVTQSSCALSTLDVVAECERDLLLHHWSRSHNTTPLRQLRVHELFEEQVKIRGNHAALKYRDITVSYQTLNEQANQLAYGLMVHVNKADLSDQNIAIFQSRSVGMIVSALAILKLGAAVVMISPEYPEPRVKALLDDSQPVCVIADEKPNNMLEGLGCSYISYQEAQKLSRKRHNLNLNGVMDSTAYLIYTSGTTGVPKGVKTTHRGVVSLVQNNGYVEFSANDRLVQLANPNFDMALFETWGALCHGGTLVIPPINQPSISEIRALLHRESITTLWLTTSLFDNLLGYAPDSFVGLKYLVFGGEAASSEAVKQLLESEFCPRHLINAYGPSESTIVTTYRCNGLKGDTVPIGKPANTRQVYVLDACKQLVPIGVKGELYVSGEGVADGYLNRPDLTQTCFVPNMFSDDNAAVMYKTGDIVRWSSNGELEYIGRNDGQVKVRGFRVELGEIERILLQHQQVKNAAVLDFKYQGQTRLVAYLQYASEQVDRRDIKAYIERCLPTYMCPNAYVQVDQFPLTYNGKLDKLKLPTPIFESDREYIAPRNEFECQMCGLFEKLLDRQKVGIDDDFFELGGHSILAMQLAHEIENLTAQVFMLRNLYSHRTVRQLAEFKPHKPQFIEPCQFLLPERLSGPTKQNDCRDTILLTGATGFIGRYVLAQLISDTDATVYCLVRANNQAQARQRLKDSLQKARLWNTSLSRRIKAVTGDLEQKRLGLDSKAYIELASKVDVIIHSATYMDHLASFEQMKAANVNSTIELIELQQQIKPKRMLFVSTTGVLKQPSLADEDTPLSQQKHAEAEGYIATKWASELLIDQARGRGFDICVVRLGLIAGSQQTGLSDEAQWLTMLMKLTSNLGVCFDDKRFKTSILPVDYVAKALVTIARQAQVLPRYHLTSEKEMYFVDLVRARNNILPKPIKLIGYAQFITSLIELKMSGKQVDGEYLFTDDMRNLAREVQQPPLSYFAPIESEKTWQWLNNQNLPAPVLREETIAKYFEVL
ncbi:amino acid adenylation domain-containing protein [Pseudoalteromonas sp. SMS1]|uniref:non-ribosomal peptide synthetase n=1 Tax=Pseudoalteromonas sp. SMS1 TaxID=2908894 RepID=UPI001F18E45C|nr:non-ribosomal peptide synthetase [Pseudoalteromonas sp. SMS1]MCF2859798.1 amino acid adenylation domain-containing protein [Pseudoalteromonas sp. SMS1]